MNMNKLINKLPILAFVLAATFAFGAQLPSLVSSYVPTKVWTPDGSQPDGYRDITNLQPQQYNCVEGSPECRVEFDNDDPATGMKNVLSTGTLVII